MSRPRPVSGRWTKPTLNTTGARPHRRTSRLIRRTGAPKIPFALLVAGLLVGGLCALLALNTASAAAELRRNDLQAANAGLAAEVEQLRTQVAAQQAPGYLASAAARLGMVPDRNPAFLELRPNGSVAVLGSPVAATGAPPPPSPSSAAAPVAPPTTKPTPTAKPSPTHKPSPTRQPSPTHKPSPTPSAQPAATPKPTATPLPGGPR